MGLHLSGLHVYISHHICTHQDGKREHIALVTTLPGQGATIGVTTQPTLLKEFNRYIYRPLRFLHAASGSGTFFSSAQSTTGLH